MKIIRMKKTPALFKTSATLDLLLRPGSLLHQYYCHYFQNNYCPLNFFKSTNRCIHVIVFLIILCQTPFISHSFTKKKTPPLLFKHGIVTYPSWPSIIFFKMTKIINVTILSCSFITLSMELK